MQIRLIAHNGSVQHLNVPSNMGKLYKTVQEIKQRIVVDMAADRGAHIDQSLSVHDRCDYGKTFFDAFA